MRNVIKSYFDSKNIYCDECLRTGIEPYNALVGMGLYYADINKMYKQKILQPSLRFHNKTKEQFDEDVKAQDDSYRVYLEWREKQCISTEEDNNEELPF